MENKYYVPVIKMVTRKDDDPIAITDEMMKAGLEELDDSDPDFVTRRALAARVYRAMEMAWRRIDARNIR